MILYLLPKKKNNKKKSILLFNNIWRFKRFFSVRKITYYIDIFEKKDQILNYSSIFSIYIGNHNEKIIKSFIVNNILMFEQNVSIEIDYSKENMKKKYIVRVLAEIDNYDGTRDKFIYNSTLVDNDNSKKVDVNENLILYVILYMTIVCVLIMIIVIIFLKIHKKKEQSSSEPDLNTSDMPLNDKERNSEI